MRKGRETKRKKGKTKGGSEKTKGMNSGMEGDEKQKSKRGNSEWKRRGN